MQYITISLGPGAFLANFVWDSNKSSQRRIRCSGFSLVSTCLERLMAILDATAERKISNREGVHAPREHCVRYLNKFSRKWSPFEALVNTGPW